MVRPAATAARLADRFFELSLLGLVSSGFLAVAGSGYLDAPTAILTAAGLLLRALLVLGIVRFEISPGTVALLTLVYLGFYALDYLAISRDFLGATVHLVCFLAVVKILTARTNRDFVYVKIIAFLELLAASILSTNVNFFVFLALFLLFAVATFASSEIRRTTRRPGAVARGGLGRFHLRLASLSVVIALGVLLLTAGLFFLLPRTAHAAFQRLGSERYQLPGFSNEVRLGQIGEILQQNTPVMHVRVEGKVPAYLLRWRGGALSSFDGRRWYNPVTAGNLLRVEEGRIIIAGDDQRRREGSRVLYEVQVEPTVSDALFFAGVPEVLWINSPMVLRSATDTYRLGYPSSAGLRYHASSYVDPELRAGDRGVWPPSMAPSKDYLQLPPVDARVRELASRVAGGSVSDEQRARTIAAYLRRSYAYTTELPAQVVRDPIAHFLFERKKGHCEYFASSMAVMLRTIGIPSRVVTGFQHGVFNPISGWYVVRASDAHSWVEAWIVGQGWTTFDPTPPDLSRRSPALLAKLALYMDAAEMFWQDWVVGYDRERQLTLALKMGDSGRGFGTRWRDQLRLAAFALWTRTAVFLGRFGFFLLCLAGFAILLRVAGPELRRRLRMLVRVQKVRRGEAQASDATILYGRMLALLRRRGFERPAWLTPGEFADQLPPSATADMVRRLTAAYNELRFGGNLEAAPVITSLLDQLERSA
jgi:transglutaminase-like putative cysteine protease